MRVCYPIRSYIPLSNFLWLIKWCLLTWSLVLIFFPTWYVSLLVDHRSPRGHLSPKSISVWFGRYEILRLTSVDLYLKELNQNVQPSILKKLLIVGSSVPSNLVLGILRYRTNSWHFITAFRSILFAWCWCRATIVYCIIFTLTNKLCLLIWNLFYWPFNVAMPLCLKNLFR